MLPVVLRRIAALALTVGLVCLASLTLQRQAWARPTGGAVPRPAEFMQRAWTIADGLPQGSIYDLAQTPDGYLWIATYGGLVRFDGRRFTVIDAATLPSLASNQVQALAVAPQGGLWVGVAGASIFRTDGRRELETLPPHPGGLRIRSLVVDRQGVLWASVDDRVLRLASHRWTEFTLPTGLRQPVRALAIDRAGAAWAGATGGVLRIHGERMDVVRVQSLPADGFIAAIGEDRTGRLWIGGSSGLYRSDPARSRFIRVAGVKDRVTAVLPRADGDVWVSTVAGLTVFAGEGEAAPDSSRSIASTDALGGSPIVHLRTTRTGAIVGGTMDAGFRVFTPRPLELLGRADGLEDVRVHHVLADGAEGVWVAAGCAGLAELPHPSVEAARVHLPPDLGLLHKCVRGLMLDRGGGLWVGQASGNLTRIRAGGKTRAWTQSDGLPAADIGPLAESREGRVWVGTSKGIVCAVTTDDAMTCPAADLGDDTLPIWSLAHAEDGSIWIGQVGRVSRVQGETVRTWTTRDGVPPFPIRVLRPGPGGTVWLGSYGGGLARMRDGRFTAVNSRQGLFDNAISAWVEDDLGAVWLLGNRGVFVGRREDLDAVADGRVATLAGMVFGPGDGVPEGNGGHPAGARLSDGRIGFATIQGLALFEPRAVPKGAAPSVIVESVSGGQPAAPEDREVVVPPGGGPIEIQLSAPTISAPDAVRIRYQLAGRDPSWVEAGADPRVTYSGLAPGDYELRVSASGASRAWSEPVNALVLHVRPLWWQTLWARLLAVLVGGAALAGAVHLRLRAPQRRNEALAREIRERVRAEEEAHRHLLALAHVGRLATAGELTASLAHDLGQPLTAIVASAEASKMLLGAPQPDHDRVREILSSISQQGRRASDVIRGLRRFLGRGAPEFAPIDVNDAVRDVMTLLHSTFVTDRIRLELQLSDGLSPIHGDRVPLQQVVMNLALNAIEAMRDAPVERRRLVVRSRPTRGGVRVSVADAGPGLEREFARKMFEPFQTTKPGGMGMGLAICRSIVEGHGGRIHARNQPAGGAVVSFTLPTAPLGED